MVVQSITGLKRPAESGWPLSMAPVQELLAMVLVPGIEVQREEVLEMLWMFMSLCLSRSAGRVYSKYVPLEFALHYSIWLRRNYFIVRCSPVFLTFTVIFFPAKNEGVSVASTCALWFELSASVCVATSCLSECLCLSIFSNKETSE